MPASSGAGGGGSSGKWLGLVGIGEDGVAGLGEAARGLVAGAEVVFGGRRHLALAAGLIRGEARAWPVPFDASAVVGLRGRAVCVLASGDPFLHGVGAVLAREVGPEEMQVVPGASAFALAAARMGWALQDCETLALHGRPAALVRPLLQAGVRVLALTGDGEGPAAVARVLVEDGFGASRVTVLEALGGPGERVVSGRAEEVAGRSFAALNLVAVEVAGGPGLPLGAGLPEAAFAHDGQISKREVRAVTLAALAPRRGELLWDVGAGSGAVGIEWMRLSPSLRAVAVEARADRAARVRANAEALGVPGLGVVEGEAPGALIGLPAPDAVFLGGGAAEAFEAAAAALRPGGRLVVNAVTLETQALVTGWRGRLGGELVSLSVARAAPVGGMTGWRPAMPVVQWAWVKP
ncbi:MAG TPA: precorrin-6y C5,15-methyltransferase (decarboxylating) subunit CbiE [Amaricoccus sp.]|nr:precorrin-6y C5,15-methyltransferase (decarboxylating) subunit CbiE [Amaricoccus sp.]